ncbi:MAG: primosomal protein N' [Thiomonas sp.]
MTLHRIAVDAPLWDALDYVHAETLPRGCLVRVPLGRQNVLGVVLGPAEGSTTPEASLRAVSEVVSALPALDADWLDLLQFAAAYYQRPLGELMAAALPTWLRHHGAAAAAKRVAAWHQRREPQAFRLTPAGGAALAQQLSPRHAALWRLAAALGLKTLQAAGAATPAALIHHDAAPRLQLDAARKLHPKAAALLRDWAAQGWVEAVRDVAQDVAQDLVRNAMPIAMRDVAHNEALHAPQAKPNTPPPTQQATLPPALQAAQQAAVDAIRTARGYAPFLLFGVTGSGKTEVYLQLAAHVLAQDPQAQVLVLTPEINLTPQLVQRFAERFPGERLAVLHSGLAEAERFDHWYAAHSGAARIVLGTRLAALASLPQLALIVVDEEHDASYKQQEGARYSARDLAVWRARQRGIAAVLGSATPSLESWRAAQRGRYRLLELPERASGSLPAVRLLHAGQDPLLRQGGLIGQALFEAITRRLARGEQSLLFLNRRGYAPVIRCPDCGWLSDCPHCDAHLVYHRTDRSLRCHHCGHRAAVPRACPDCGSLDLQPLGRGTQRVEEALATLFPQARIARIDADTARRKGAAQAGFAQMHAGEVDILVGTQMITKGHDFQRVTLVAALNPDAGLFTHDLRGPERLFAQLMQAAGRAGRADSRPADIACADAAASSSAPEMLVQTAYPEHGLYRALVAHDYPGFAARELKERQHGGMPPFSHQALLRAEHKKPEVLDAFLAQAIQLAAAIASAGQGSAGLPQASLAPSGGVSGHAGFGGRTPTGLMVYPPVPASLARVADVHRTHVLVEGSSRAALQDFLVHWRGALQQAKARVRWAIDVDPTEF